MSLGHAEEATSAPDNLIRELCQLGGLGTVLAAALRSAMWIEATLIEESTTTPIGLTAAPWIPTDRTQTYCRDGNQTDHALTFKLNQPD